jgi:hypothetical protein
MNIIARTRFAGGGALLAMVLGLGACQGQIDDAEENALIVDYLAQRGFDPTTIDFDGDRVLLTADSSVPRDRVLEAMVSAPAGPAGDDDALVEKGYFRAGFGVPYAKKIGIRFDDNVPQYIRNAVNAAAVEWSGPSLCVKAGTHHTGPGTSFVQIGYYLTGGNSLASADSGFSACRQDQTDPHEVRNCAQLGTWIAFSTKYFPSSPTFADTEEAHETAVHEFGHILGFQHPWQGGAVHVTGTGWADPKCNGNGGTCKPKYPSVMDYLDNGPGLDNHLTADDVKSLQKIYSRSRPTCTLP